MPAIQKATAKSGETSARCRRKNTTTPMPSSILARWSVTATLASAPIRTSSSHTPEVIDDDVTCNWRGQQPDAAVTILNTSGMNDRVQQQTLHVDENMSFLAFDQFARIEPVRINA